MAVSKDSKAIDSCGLDAGLKYHYSPVVLLAPVTLFRLYNQEVLQDGVLHCKNMDHMIPVTPMLRLPHDFSSSTTQGWHWVHRY